MTVPPLPSPGDTIAGHTLLRVVGEGGVGVVFEARDRLGRSVAMKFLRPEKSEDPDAVADFTSEAEATAAVGHDNVVLILGHGEEGGRHFILMEFVDGPPLHRLLKERVWLPWAEATRILIQVARALGHAHGKGLLHRDVKPQNIILYRDGRVRLTDFGIVKDISSLKGYLVKGRSVGTAAYASPEQVLGKRLDASTDMYSLGAAFYHMVCGRPPFAGGSRSDTMKMHVNDDPQPPSEIVPEIPKALCNAILRMLAKKQADRYPGMEKLVRDLEAILLGRVPIGEAAPRVDPATVKVVKRAARPAAEPDQKRSRIAEVILVIALLAATAGLVALSLLS